MGLFRAIVVAALLAGSSACGWHMAGRYDVPVGLQPMYLDAADVTYEMREGLRQALTVSGTRLVHDLTDARSVLRLTDSHMDRRLLSVGPDGKVREHELRFQVTFEVRTPDGTVLHSPQTLELTRDTSFDEDNVLGREGEERVLRTEMEQQAVQQILRRLQAVLAGAA